jgi:hypothetical protein
VVDPGRWLEQEHSLTVVAGDSDAKLGLLTAERDFADAAQAGPETPGLLQIGPAEGHVGADEVADGTAVGSGAPMGASHDPIELGRKPGWPACFPIGGDGAAHADDVRIAVIVSQPFDPVRGGSGVIIQKGDYLSSSVTDCGVAGARQALLSFVADDLQLQIWGHSGQFLASSIKKVLGVIHDDHGLARGNGLRLH